MKLGKKLILYYLVATLLTVILVGFAVLGGIERLSASTIEQQLIDQSNLAEIYISQMHMLQDNLSVGLSAQTAENVIGKLGLILGNVRIYDNNLLLLAESKSGDGIPDSGNIKILSAAQGENYAYVVRDGTVYFASPVSFEGNMVCILEIIYPMSFFKNLIAGVTDILFIGVFIFILIMTLLSAYIARRLTRPINQLALVAGNYANRDFTPVEIRSSGEIAQLCSSFNAMGTQLKDYIQRQKQFVSNVSHELRTPLTAIIGYSGILADELKDRPDLEKAIYHLNNESKRLEKLVDEVITLSRIDSDRETFDLNKLSLSDIVRETTEKMQLRAEKYGIRVFSKTEPDIFIRGDHEKLVQVIVNLLDNAFKFSPSGSDVWIILDRDGDMALLSVIDQGIGIPPEETEKVFNRFYRAENARGISGTGLGLSIVKFIVEAHKGAIEIKPGSDGGTAVNVKLPVMK